MELPLYKLVINEDDETGVTAVALVDKPAIEVNWMAFNEQKPFKFETVNAEKRIIAGALMLADTPIYRRTEAKGEFNVIFEKPTIEQIVTKYHKNSFEKNVNPMHESMMILPDIFMISDFIINRDMGYMPPKGFENLPDGSWFGQFKVNNDLVWNDYIKTGIFQGFSVEGFFDEVPANTPNQVMSDEEFNALLEALNSIFS